MRQLSRFLILLLICQSITSITSLANNSDKAGALATVNRVVQNTIKPEAAATLITRRPPKLNRGVIEGSITVLLAESFNVNGNATVIGDIYVPGSPEIKRNGDANYQGTIVGNGNQQPANYKINLNGNSAINHIVTQTDAITIDNAPEVTQPAGFRDLFLIKGDQPGDFATMRDLTLTRRYNLLLAVPPGAYGDFVAHKRSGFIFGIDNQTTVYHLQSLTLNSNSQLQIRGNVTLNIRNNLTLNSNAKMGNASNPVKLAVNIENGDATFNSSSAFFGTLNAPAGEVTLNSNSLVVSLIKCDRAAFNSNCQLKRLSTTTTAP